MTHTTRAHLPATATLIGMCLLALTGCQTTGGSNRVQDSELLADRALDNAEYADAAAIYARLADSAMPARAAELSLASALAWLDAGEAERAREVGAPTLAELDASTPDRHLYAAGQAILTGNFADAEAPLAALATATINTRQRLRYQRWRAAALYAAGDPALATSFLAQRELWLTSERAVAENHQQIWDGLRATDFDILYEALSATSDTTVRGWLELVVTTSPVRASPGALAAVVTAWTQRFQSHPANATFVPALLGDGAPLSLGPNQIALLLPLNGRGQTFATAIRDGFLAAHIADLANGDTAPRIRLYDVNRDGASAAMRSALADGADFIVGPLTKTAATEIALQPVLPVTTLALNRLPADASVPAGMYQFGLAPEDEAAAAAERAALVGLTRAVALVPYGELGDRLLAAFAERYQSTGGVLLDVERYEPRETDFSVQIRRLLQIQSSISRRQRVQNLLGEVVKYEPRRRHDIDVIFLPAAPAQARLLMPQLNFHYAGDIPTFATAQIANKDGRASRELAGIEHAEIPWVVDADSTVTPTAAEMAASWRSETQLRRLYALGMDAYRLARQLPLADGEPVQGASGVLFVDASGVVRRRLIWARFDGEDSAALPQVLPTNETLDDAAWQDYEDRSGSD